MYAGWWFGTWMDDFSHYIGNVIIPTDQLIFFRGVGLNHQAVYVFFSHRIWVNVFRCLHSFDLRKNDGPYGREWANLSGLGIGLQFGQKSLDDWSRCEWTLNKLWSIASGPWVYFKITNILPKGHTHSHLIELVCPKTPNSPKPYPNHSPQYDSWTSLLYTSSIKEYDSCCDSMTWQLRWTLQLSTYFYDVIIMDTHSRGPQKNPS